MNKAADTIIISISTCNLNLNPKAQHFINIYYVCATIFCQLLTKEHVSREVRVEW